MNKKILPFIFLLLLLFSPLDYYVSAQDGISVDPFVVDDEAVVDMNFHQIIKTKFVEGSVFFMSFIALALIIGLAFCLERIIYLNLSQVNTKKLLSRIEGALLKGDLEEAKNIARNSRGPVASICYQGLLRVNENIDVVEKSIIAYGSVQAGLLEKNFSWISLFIAMAPSLGFLGTVVGMIQAFDNIQQQADISPTIVAEGMKIALITTVGGLIVAMILQVFYNYVLTKEEGILNEMEDSSITLLDMIIQYKLNFQKAQ